MFGDRKLSAAPKSASISVANKRRNLLSASLSQETQQQQQQSNPTIERTIYRSAKYSGDDECNERPKSEISMMDQVSVCSSVFSSEIDKKVEKKLARPATAKVNHQISPIKINLIDNENECSNKLSRLRKMSRNSVDWPCLGEKIENWFEMAKTPDQRVVYGFLNDLKPKEKNEMVEEMREISSTTTTESKSKLSDRAQSLEDILRNLKKYRTKFSSSSSRCSRPVRANSKQQQQEEEELSYCAADDDNEPSYNRKKSWTCRERTKSAAVTAAHQQRHQLLRDNFTCTTLDKEMSNRVLESTTWRVMRHLRSADIRNKYPLPKANPDYHFRNSTIFVAAGRPPKATFLLHPDWV